MKSIFEQSSGTYTLQGDYRLPNISLPAEEERPIGVWGQRRLRYLKQHHRVVVLQSAHFRQASFPPCRYRRTGTSSLF